MSEFIYINIFLQTVIPQCVLLKLLFVLYLFVVFA